VPSGTFVAQIANAVGVSADWILGISESRTAIPLAEHEAKLAEKDAEIARLNGIIEGLRLAFITTGKGK
jgi:hypothetical protein